GRSRREQRQRLVVTALGVERVGERERSRLLASPRAALHLLPRHSRRSGTSIFWLADAERMAHAASSSTNGAPERRSCDRPRRHETKKPTPDLSEAGSRGFMP